MNNKSPGAWMALNTTYYAAPLSNPIHLLKDGQQFLVRAYGMVRMIHAMLEHIDRVDKQTLAESLEAINTLLDMGTSSIEVALERYRELGDEWDAAEEDEAE